MIKRLRPSYTPEELKDVYATPHDHSIFPDHVIRVEKTLELAKRLISTADFSGADLSCGNGCLLDNLDLDEKIYGDYAPGYQFQGPIEETTAQIPNVDVFVLCETLEHLEDPLGVLRIIRAKSGKLILSTPLGEDTDENPEHYWGWDDEGVRYLLKAAGWTPTEYEETNPPIGYRFQIWGCI
jgi:hypothetical protein